MEVPPKLKNKTTIQSSNSTSGYLSEKMKTQIQKDICTPMFTAALFTRARTWKQLRYPPTDKWIKKLWWVYTVKYFSVIKRNASEPLVVSG